MQHTLRKTRVTIFGLLIMFGILAAPLAAYAAPFSTAAQAKQAICEGIGATGTGCTTAGSTNLNRAIRLAVNVLSIVAGIAGVVMVIVGGLKYITSQGDASQISSAKNTVIYAVVGLAVAGLAQFIVRFVLSKAQG